MKSISNRGRFLAGALATAVFATSMISCGGAKDSTEALMEDIIDAKIVPVKVIGEDKLAGFVDANGELVIPARFKDAHYFHCGLSLVADTAGLFGYIKTDGTYAIEPRYASATEFSDGMAWVAEPDSALMVIDTKGNVKFRFPKALAADMFAEGYAAYRTAEGNAGVLTADGSEITLPANFKIAEAISGKKIFYQTTDGPSRIGRIVGNALEPVEIPGEPDIEAVNLDKELVIFYLDGKRGIMDFDGQIIVNARYKKMDFDGKDLVIFENDKEKHGWLDLKGEVVIQPKYKAVRSLFNNTDYAVVSTSGTKFQTIDRRGETVIKPKYKFLYRPVFAPDIFAMKEDDLAGLMSPDGQVLCEPQFKSIFFSSRHIIFATSGDDKWGVISTAGQFRGPIDYEPLLDVTTTAQSQKVDVQQITDAALTLLDKAKFGVMWPAVAEQFSVFKTGIDQGATEVAMQKITLPGASICLVACLDYPALTNARYKSNTNFNPNARPYAYSMSINLNSAASRDAVFTALEQATGVQGAITPAEDVEGGVEYTPNSINIFKTEDETSFHTIK